MHCKNTAKICTTKNTTKQMNIDYKSKWENCRHFISDNISPEQYKTIFAFVEFESFNDGKLYLNVPSSFVKDVIENPDITLPDDLKEKIIELANKLIEYSGVPIAAPSANKFSHISPVNPYHVFEDFKEFPVKILNGGVSKYCMESTVMKICYEEKKLLIFRLGAVSPDDLKRVLDTDEQFKNYKIECLTKKLKVTTEDLRKIKEQKSKDNSLTINQDAPGQFLKHYSPKLQTYLYSGEDLKDFVEEIKINDKMIFIDYKEIMKNKFLGKYEIKEKNFLELAKDGNPNTVMQNFYNSLHEAEKKEGMKYIIIIDLEKYMDDNSHKLTLLDRIWKAAAFKKVKLII